jgi:hypothetical protein
MQKGISIKKISADSIKPVHYNVLDMWILLLAGWVLINNSKGRQAVIWGYEDFWIIMLTI